MTQSNVFTRSSLKDEIKNVDEARSAINLRPEDGYLQLVNLKSDLHQRNSSWISTYNVIIVSSRNAYNTVGGNGGSLHGERDTVESNDHQD